MRKFLFLTFCFYSLGTVFIYILDKFASKYDWGPIPYFFILGIMIMAYLVPFFVNFPEAKLNSGLNDRQLFLLNLIQIGSLVVLGVIGYKIIIKVFSAYLLLFKVILDMLIDVDFWKRLIRWPVE